jgi:hypothetical protein
MDPKLLRLRSFVIANADRFPELGATWYERGFEGILSTLASSFDRLAKRKLLHVAEPSLAADHFVGMLLWIQANRDMFTGDRAYYTGVNWIGMPTQRQMRFSVGIHWRRTHGREADAARSRSSGVRRCLDNCVYRRASMCSVR